MHIPNFGALDFSGTEYIFLEIRLPNTVFRLELKSKRPSRLLRILDFEPIAAMAGSVLHPDVDDSPGSRPLSRVL
jgi:hypothetical protein